jgi:hypothetical protein
VDHFATVARREEEEGADPWRCDAARRVKVRRSDQSIRSYHVHSSQHSYDALVQSTPLLEFKRLLRRAVGVGVANPWLTGRLIELYFAA